MALVVTVGSSDATSLATNEEAATILADAPFDASSWDEMEEAAQDQCLTLAALALDWMPLRGYRVYADQALPFPRTHQKDTTVIPDEVKTAQVYGAFLVVKPAFEKIGNEAGSIGKAEVKSVTLEGLVSMTFASDALQRQGGIGSSSLTRLFLSRESPIWILMSRHLSRFRCIGAVPRPTLLDAVS